MKYQTHCTRKPADAAVVARVAGMCRVLRAPLFGRIIVTSVASTD